jgi:hypothetical protein
LEKRGELQLLTDFFLSSVSPLFYMNKGETAVPGSFLKHPGTEDKPAGPRDLGPAGKINFL